MRGVKLNTVEAGHACDCCRGGETPNDVLQLGRAQRARNERAGERYRNSARRDRHVGASEAVRLTTRVIQLHPGLAAALLGGDGPTSHPIDVAFVLDHHVSRLREVATVNRDVAGDEEPEPVVGPAPVDALELRRRRATAPGKRLVHRRFHQAVLQLLPAAELKRFPQGGGAQRPGHAGEG